MSRNSDWTKKPGLLVWTSPDRKAPGQAGSVGLDGLRDKETEEEAKATPDPTTVRISKLSWRY